MILHGRLSLIREMLPACVKLCDVGTDHARIPASALLDGLCRNAIATDIRPGPLERAERTIRRFGLKERMELRLGAGLDPIVPGECDVLVIAGMGALMIIDILESGSDVARQAQCIILQPMHAQEKLRPWLRMNGYAVLSERLACEGEKRYQVLAVRYHPNQTDRCPPFAILLRPQGWMPVPDVARPGFPSDPANPIYDRLGFSIVNVPDPLVVPWVLDWTKRQRRIVAGLQKSGREPENLAAAKGLLEQLEDCLPVLKNGGGGA